METDLELQKTLELFQKNLGNKFGQGTLNKDITTSLLLQPYNLEQEAKLLFPVMSPLRNIIPRQVTNGNAAHVKAITAINSTTVSIFASEGTVGNQPTTVETDFAFNFVSMALYDAVTWEAQQYGRGFADVLALASANLLRAAMQGEELAILFGNTATAVTGDSSAGASVSIGGKTGTPAAPTVAKADTGGTFAAATYYVGVTEVTGMGESHVSSLTSIVVSADGTSTVTVTPAATHRNAGSPILYYNVYIGTTNSNSGATFQKITQATNGAAVTLTSYTAGTVTPPQSDSTGSSLAFNGLFSQIAGNASGLSGVGTGSYVKFLNGALTLAAVHNMFKSIFDVARGMPEQIQTSSTDSSTLTDLVLPAGSAQPYMLILNEQRNLTGDYRIGKLINRVTGSEIEVNTHPFIPQGNMLALSAKLPPWYPGSGVDAVWKMLLNTDYTQFNYAPTGPKYPLEIRWLGALALYLPSIQGWLGGIQ